MDFESPDVAKEFPGLYMGDAGKTLTDPPDFEDDEKSKRKKDKKDGKKEKGYAALAGESSPEEDELDPKSPGKTKKIKASFKLSAKKKDKKVGDKSEKDSKSSKKLEKRLTEDEKKQDKSHSDKDKTKDKDKKSVEKDKKKEEKKKKLSIGGDKDIHGKSGSTSIGNAASPSHTEKEKGLNLNQALNAFLNAPAPLLLKREKDHKKDKEPSSATKVKLKLKRSKNSLEESQSSHSDLPFTVTHQFPEDPEAITKEIRKYEALLEQTHSSIKASKKVSKKSEEQLWELQRTLTQLKRKLRSINALSVSSPANVPSYPPAPVADAPSVVPAPTAPAPSAPAPKPTVEPAQPPALPKSEDSAKRDQKDSVQRDKSEVVVDKVATATTEDHVMRFDFTLKAPSAMVTGESGNQEQLPDKQAQSVSPMKQEVKVHQVVAVPESEIGHLRAAPYVGSDPGSSNSNLNSITPEPLEVQRLQVEVQIHRSAPQDSRSSAGSDEVDGKMGASGVKTGPTTEVKLNSAVIKALTFSDEEMEAGDEDVPLGADDADDDDDDDDIEEITDVSSLSLRNTNIENENSFLDDGVDLRSEMALTATDPAVAEVDPFEMPIFDTEEYLTIENEALIFFNEELQEEIQREEAEIEALMKQLEQMSLNGVDIDAPEIDLDLDQFEFEELVSLWQITKLENEALNDQVNHLRQMVALNKLEEFRLETRLKYLEERASSGRNCAPIPVSADVETFVT